MKTDEVAYMTEITYELLKEWITQYNPQTCPFKTLAMKAVVWKVLNSNSNSDTPVMLNSPIFCFTCPFGIPKKLLPGMRSTRTGGLLKKMLLSMKSKL